MDIIHWIKTRVLLWQSRFFSLTFERGKKRGREVFKFCRPEARLRIKLNHAFAHPVLLKVPVLDIAVCDKHGFSFFHLPTSIYTTDCRRLHVSIYLYY